MSHPISQKTIIFQNSTGIDRLPVPPFVEYHTVLSSFSFAKDQKKIYAKVVVGDDVLTISETNNLSEEEEIYKLMKNRFTVTTDKTTITLHPTGPISLNFLQESIKTTGKNHPYCSSVKLFNGWIASTYGTKINLWDTNGILMKVLDRGKAPIYSLCALPESDGRLISGDQKGTIIIWDINNSEQPIVIDNAMQNPIFSIIPIHFDKKKDWDGTFASAAAGISIWNIKKLEANAHEQNKRKIHITRKEKPENTYTYSLAPLNNGSIACGYSDNKIFVFNYDLAFAAKPDEHGIVYLSEKPDHETNFQAYECRKEDETAHSAPIYSLLSYDESKFISGSDGSIKIWDISNLDQISSEELPLGTEGIIFSLAFFKSDGKLISGSSKSLIPEAHNDLKTEIKFWDITKKKCTESFTNYNQPHCSIVHALGDALITGSLDGTIKIWRNWKDNIKDCRNALWISPNEYELYAKLSKLYKKQLGAQKSVSERMQLFLSGMSYYGSIDAEKAEEFYRKAIHLDVENPSIYLTYLSNNPTQSKIIEAYQTLVAIYENYGLASYHEHYLKELISLDTTFSFDANKRILAKVKKVALDYVKTISQNDRSKAFTICKKVQNYFQDHKSAFLLLELNPELDHTQSIQYYFLKSEHAFQKRKWKIIIDAFTKAKEIDSLFSGLKDEEKLTFFTRKLTAKAFEIRNEINKIQSTIYPENYRYSQKTIILEKLEPKKLINASSTNVENETFLRSRDSSVNSSEEEDSIDLLQLPGTPRTSESEDFLVGSNEDGSQSSEDKEQPIILSQQSNTTPQYQIPEIPYNRTVQSPYNYLTQQIQLPPVPPPKHSSSSSNDDFEQYQ